MVVAVTGETTNRRPPGGDLPQRRGAFFLNFRMRRQILKGSTSRAGKLTTESGSAAPVNSQNARNTGSNSSAARLSATTSTNGRSTVRRNKTTINALAAGESPVTRIRPALSADGGRTP